MNDMNRWNVNSDSSYQLVEIIHRIVYSLKLIYLDMHLEIIKSFVL